MNGLCCQSQSSSSISQPAAAGKRPAAARGKKSKGQASKKQGKKGPAGKGQTKAGGKGAPPPAGKPPQQQQKGAPPKAPPEDGSNRSAGADKGSLMITVGEDYKPAVYWVARQLTMSCAGWDKLGQAWPPGHGVLTLGTVWFWQSEAELRTVIPCVNCRAIPPA